MRRLRIAALVLLGLGWAMDAAGDEPLYRCPGEPPLYTNRAELGCPAHVPQGRVVTAPPGLTWPEVKTLAIGPVSPDLSPSSTLDDAVPAEGESLCDLYREWARLNLKSQGGLYSLTIDERQRWMGLQKLFTLAGVPPCR